MYLARFSYNVLPVNRQRPWNASDERCKPRGARALIRDCWSHSPVERVALHYSLRSN